VLSALGVELRMEPIGYECVVVGARDKIDGTAPATVTAIGAATRHKLLATEAHAPVAAVTGLNLDVDFVDEHRAWARTGEEVAGARESPGLRLGVGDGNDADATAVRAVVRELDVPRDLRKQRVVFAEPHIWTRLETPTSLPHEDRSTGHQVAVKALYAQPLGVTVASVS